MHTLFSLFYTTLPFLYTLKRMLDALGFGYSEKKCKPLLKMASKRIDIAVNKMNAMASQSKREVARLLNEGKEEKARIRVEHIIRTDFKAEAYEILSLMCDLLSERIRYLSAEELWF